MKKLPAEEREYMVVVISMTGKYSEEYCMSLSDKELEELYARISG